MNYMQTSIRYFCLLLSRYYCMILYPAWTVENAFGGDIDYAMLIKLYESSQEETRYSPAV